jgi:hypothetical protein
MPGAFNPGLVATLEGNFFFDNRVVGALLKGDASTDVNYYPVASKSSSRSFAEPSSWMTQSSL